MEVRSWHKTSPVWQVSLSTDAALRKKVNAHVANLEQELSVLSQLRHTNIVRYYVRHLIVPSCLIHSGSIFSFFELIPAEITSCTTR